MTEQDDLQAAESAACKRLLEGERGADGGWYGGRIPVEWVDAYRAAIEARVAAASRERIEALEAGWRAVDDALTPWLHGERIDPKALSQAMALFERAALAQPPAAQEVE